MNKHNTIDKAETGFVSIVVTMILMIVLSLIVMGFAQLSRREQRMALDRQLSTQAYYAAESGIKDAIKAFKADPYNFADKITCDTTTAPWNGTLSTNVSYTCLLINTKVDKILLEPLVSGVVVPIRNTDLASLEISWDADKPADALGEAVNSTFATSTQYPTLLPLSAWTAANVNTNVLEVTITQLATPTRTNLTANSFTAFLYPSDNLASGSYGVSLTDVQYADIKNQGSLINAKCNNANTPRKCKVNFTNLPGTDASKGYVVRIKTVYGLENKNYVAIRGTDTWGNNIKFIGSQINIDSTGKAGDVLRRIQVRYPINQPAYDSIPLSAVESTGSMCKQISVTPTEVTDEFSGTNGDGACPSFDYPL